MFEAIRQYIRSHSRSRVLGFGARVASKYLRSYHNEAFYDFARNGERFAIETFRRWASERPVHVWDVGANHGQWAREAHSVLPTATITSFEIIPAIAAELELEARPCAWWRVVQSGLSDHPGSVEVVWNRSHDDMSALAPSEDCELYAHSETQAIACSVTTLDHHWRAGVTSPDLIKIDVEGHDAAVLDGGSELLTSPCAPAMIQFEYGITWVPADRMLGPVQKRLEAFGYSVGRLYPGHVDFRPFARVDENFRMGNMIAVRDERLREMLHAIR